MLSSDRIRTATHSDIQKIIALVQMVWPSTYTAIIGAEQVKYMLEQFYSVEALESQMNNGHVFLLFEENGIVQGFASYSEVEERTFKLHKLYVLTGYQKKGIGKRLIERVEKLVSSHSGEFLRLNVNRDNKAKDFYERLGYSVLKEEDIDIGEGFYMNDYVMEKRIR